MSTNNPMTEGEALAVMRELRDTGDVSDWQAMESALTMAIDRLTDHTAASGGEVACHRWWRNGELVDSAWTNGPPSERQIEAQRQCRDIADWTVEYAYRAPPAAVPADALERLLCRVYTDAYQAGHHDTVEGGYTDVLPVDRDSYWRETVADEYADELAALIPKGADHEQR